MWTENRLKDIQIHHLYQKYYNIYIILAGTAITEPDACLI